MPDRPNKDFESLKEGDLVPSLNKPLKHLIIRDSSIIIFIDEDGYVEWDTTDEYGDIPSGANLILSEVAALQEEPIDKLSDAIKFSFRVQLGEGLAQSLYHKDHAAAVAHLERAEAFLKSRQRELARGWVLTTNFVGLILLATAVVVLWWLRGSFSDERAFWSILMALSGGAGAALSVFMKRTEDYPLDPFAGAWRHRLDAIIRLTVGAFSGLLVYVFSEAHVLLGDVVKDGHQKPLLVGLAVLAGYVERTIPNLVERFQPTITGASSRVPAQNPPPAPNTNLPDGGIAPNPAPDAKQPHVGDPPARTSAAQGVQETNAPAVRPDHDGGVASADPKAPVKKVEDK